MVCAEDACVVLGLCWRRCLLLAGKVSIWGDGSSPQLEGQDWAQLVCWSPETKEDPLDNNCYVVFKYLFIILMEKKHRAGGQNNLCESCRQVFLQQVFDFIHSRCLLNIFPQSMHSANRICINCFRQEGCKGWRHGGVRGHPSTKGGFKVSYLCLSQ